MSFRREPGIEDYPALGFVPCPGDQASMDEVTRKFSDTAEVLAEVNAVLTGADEGEWRGETARAFREMLEDDFRPKVEEALQSFGDAHRALSDWVEAMQHYQARADALEVDAAAALEDLQAAEAALEGMGAPPGPFEPEPETEEERDEREQEQELRERHEQDLRVADAALAEFRDRAQILRDEYNRAGDDIADRLRDAMDLAPNKPGFWSSVADAVGDLMDGFTDLIDALGAGLIDILAEWAPILSKIGAIAGLLSSITGLLALIPGLQFLGPVSLVLAGVSMLANYGAAVGTTGSFTAAFADPAFLLSAASFAFGAGSFIGTTVLAGRGAIQSLGQTGSVFGWALRNGSSASQLPGMMGLTTVTNLNTGALRFMDGFGNAGTVMDPGSLFSGWSTDTSPVASD